MADTKTITVEEDGALTIEQTSQVDEGVEMSASGFRLNTGMGWGVDIAVVLVVVALLYIGKKFVDKRFNSKEAKKNLQCFNKNNKLIVRDIAPQLISIEN